jgi:CBS domain-containing protein
MSKPISTMMAGQATAVDMDDSIEQVEAVLRANNLSALPVIDSANRSVVGVISARDLVRFHSEKRSPADVHAWEVCSYNPVEAGPDAPVSEVARLMVERGVHHVVITENKEIKGIVSALDFVKQFIQEDS